MVGSDKTAFTSDSELFGYIKKHLTVALVCDALDMAGHRHQAMHSRIRPLLPDIANCGVVGRARTLQWMETSYVVEADSLRPGDVVVHSTDRSGTSAPWGQLVTNAALLRGAVGCICDSNVRDCFQIIKLGFPVFCAGIRPADSKGRARVEAIDEPVVCGEVTVKPGDLIVADFDGVVVVPRAIENRVIEFARQKVEGESKTLRDLMAGRRLRDVYNDYGVL
jgi:4-hydroxy-4-methyl-2-oxoglutarate aldolase